MAGVLASQRSFQALGWLYVLRKALFQSVQFVGYVGIEIAPSSGVSGHHDAGARFQKRRCRCLGMKVTLGRLRPVRRIWSSSHGKRPSPQFGRLSVPFGNRLSSVKARQFSSRKCLTLTNASCVPGIPPPPPICPNPRIRKRLRQNRQSCWQLAESTRPPLRVSKWRHAPSHF